MPLYVFWNAEHNSVGPVSVGRRDPWLGGHLQIGYGRFSPFHLWNASRTGTNLSQGHLLDSVQRGRVSDHVCLS